MGGIGKFLSGGILGGLLGKDQKNPGVTAVADPYGDVRTKLNDWLGKNIGQPGKSYTGETVAPMSDQEKASLGKVDQYANSSLGDTFTNAKKVINDTLTNPNDPASSPYYQAVKAEAQRNLDLTNKQIASNTAGGGRYYSGARVRNQREAGVDVNNALNTKLGEMAMQERQNQINMVPQALTFAQTEQNNPLQQAAALQTYGALPRTIAQAQDQASLEDWLRSNYQWPTQIGSLAAGVQQAPLYQQNAPSFGQQLQSSAAQMLPQLAMMAMMGCWVAAKVFGSMWHPKTKAVRHYVNRVAPAWFRSFYIKNGPSIACFLEKFPVFKILLRPLFEVFASIGARKAWLTYGF